MSARGNTLGIYMDARGDTLRTLEDTLRARGDTSRTLGDTLHF